jgi:hypothetical protein
VRYNKLIIKTQKCEQNVYCHCKIFTVFYFFLSKCINDKRNILSITKVPSMICYPFNCFIGLAYHRQHIHSSSSGTGAAYPSWASLVFSGFLVVHFVPVLVHIFMFSVSCQKDIQLLTAILYFFICFFIFVCRWPTATTRVLLVKQAQLTLLEHLC